MIPGRTYQWGVGWAMCNQRPPSDTMSCFVTLSLLDAWGRACHGDIRCICITTVGSQSHPWCAELLSPHRGLGVSWVLSLTAVWGNAGHFSQGMIVVPKSSLPSLCGLCPVFVARGSLSPKIHSSKPRGLFCEVSLFSATGLCNLHDIQSETPFT